SHARQNFFTLSHRYTCLGILIQSWQFALPSAVSPFDALGLSTVPFVRSLSHKAWWRWPGAGNPARTFGLLRSLCLHPQSDVLGSYHFSHRIDAHTPILVRGSDYDCCCDLVSHPGFRRREKISVHTWQAVRRLR